MRSIIVQKNFEKSYIKLSGKIKELFKKRRDLFLEDPKNPLLGIHVLHGNYDGYKSFNVTSDVRVIFKEVREDIFVFVDIGSHSELYK